MSQHLKVSKSLKSIQCTQKNPGTSVFQSVLKDTKLNKCIGMYPNSIKCIQISFNVSEIISYNNKHFPVIFHVKLLSSTDTSK